MTIDIYCNARDYYVHTYLVKKNFFIALYYYVLSKKKMSLATATLLASITEVFQFHTLVFEPLVNLLDAKTTPIDLLFPAF